MAQAMMCEYSSKLCTLSFLPVGTASLDDFALVAKHVIEEIGQSNEYRQPW